MVYLVLIVGIVNLVLGFALAVYLETAFPTSSTPAYPGAILHWAAWKRPAGDGGGARASAYPAAWTELFRQQGFSPRNPYEALLLALRFQADDYRRQLLEIQRRIQSALGDGDREAIGSLLTDLQKLSRFWAQVRGEALAHLEKRGDRFGKYRDNVNPLQGLLMEQEAGVGTAADMIARSALDDDKKGSVKRIVDEMSRLIDFVFHMRDAVEQYLAGFYRTEKRLLHLEPAILSDLQLDMFNRAGLEAEFGRRWHKVPDFDMIVSAIVVDLRECDMLNRRYGRIAVDRIINALAEIIGHSTRKDQRADLAARIGGHTFAVILRDADLKGALCVAERIRQTVEQSTFRAAEETIAVSVICGALQFDDTTPFETVLERLDSLKRFAEKEPRSRTVLLQDDSMTEHPAEPIPIRPITCNCG